MLTSGDVLDVDLGVPEGCEAGFRHPAIVVTAQRILDEEPSVVHVVPLTTAVRAFGSEVVVEPDYHNGLAARSSAQCQHVRSLSASRVRGVRGNVGPAALAEIREVVGLLLDVPS